MPAVVDRLGVGARAASVTGWTLFSELITSIGLFTAIGFGLDKLFGTAPICVAIGALVGNAMGIYIAFWRFGQMKADNEGRKRQSR